MVVDSIEIFIIIVASVVHRHEVEMYAVDFDEVAVLALTVIDVALVHVKTPKIVAHGRKDQCHRHRHRLVHILSSGPTTRITECHRIRTQSKASTTQIISQATRLCPIKRTQTMNTTQVHTQCIRLWLHQRQVNFQLNHGMERKIQLSHHQNQLD